MTLLASMSRLVPIFDAALYEMTSQVLSFGLQDIAAAEPMIPLPDLYFFQSAPVSLRAASADFRETTSRTVRQYKDWGGRLLDATMPGFVFSQSNIAWRSRILADLASISSGSPREPLS